MYYKKLIIYYRGYISSRLLKNHFFVNLKIEKFLNCTVKEVSIGGNVKCLKLIVWN